ncbi:MAG: TetR/AcrR family transcriptional regulator [Planctomycetes bacterium]|nr:TetR/AcrR family transcriptional regulator [Planctomycetota bacterium]
MSIQQKRLGRPPNRELQSRRREEILDGAALLFAERGYDHSDTQSLVAALGVGKGTLYRYFDSKQELFLAVVNRAMDRLDECIEQALAAVADPIDRFESAITAYLKFFAESPAVVELLIQERAIFRDTQRPVYFERKAAKAERRHQMLAELIAAGRLRQMPVDCIGEVLGNQLYGTMFTNHFAGRRQSFEAQVQDILDIVFHGILTDAERERRAGRAASPRHETTSPSVDE